MQNTLKAVHPLNLDKGIHLFNFSKLANLPEVFPKINVHSFQKII